jgi:hypothetical protein
VAQLLVAAQVLHTADQPWLDHCCQPGVLLDAAFTNTLILFCEGLAAFLTRPKSVAYLARLAIQTVSISGSSLFLTTWSTDVSRRSDDGTRTSQQRLAVC